MTSVRFLRKINDRLNKAAEKYWMRMEEITMKKLISLLIVLCLSIAAVAAFAEGDRGRLSYQGTRYLGFERV